MEVINLGSSRKFLRERPIRLKLFDRPRLVGELICLEPGQQDMKRTYEASDALYVIVEGHGHLKTEVQGQVLDRLDALVVPPGVEHFLVNDGSEQMTALVMLSPNPLFDSRRDFAGPGRGRPAERGAKRNGRAFHPVLAGIQSPIVTGKSRRAAASVWIQKAGSRVDGLLPHGAKERHLEAPQDSTSVPASVRLPTATQAELTGEARPAAPLALATTCRTTAPARPGEHRSCVTQARRVGLAALWQARGQSTRGT